MTEERFQVRHEPDRSRYALLDHDRAGDQVIGEEDYADVAADGGTQRVLYHTVVSDDYAGQGLASVLVRAAVEDTIAAGHAIVPVCPYVKAWLPKHPEYAAHVVNPRPEHLRAVPAPE